MHHLAGARRSPSDADRRPRDHRPERTNHRHNRSEVSRRCHATHSRGRTAARPEAGRLVGRHDRGRGRPRHGGGGVRRHARLRAVLLLRGPAGPPPDHRAPRPSGSRRRPDDRGAGPPGAGVGRLRGDGGVRRAREARGTRRDAGGPRPAGRGAGGALGAPGRPGLVPLPAGGTRTPPAGVLGRARHARLRRGVLLHLSLALALTFFLLRDGSRIEAWFLDEIADEDSSAYAFLRGTDADLETVYVGTVLSVLGVTVAAVLAYNGYNLLVPAAVDLPVPTLLALLTGLATFVPIVVGKLVYLPAGGYLLWEATRVDAALVYPVAFLLVSFLLLDILPQTVLRPLIAGRSLHSGLVLFAYVLGAAYFGWYGLFLGPLLVVLAVQLLKHVLPDLVGGDPFVPEADEGVQIGSDPLAEAGEERDGGTGGEGAGAGAGGGADDG
ncbi:hypothetical protein BRC93_12280 [Halobacteriales archaeon QS_5_70_15]|nr:MAG: hypothetical protein BRC93_12280 [Halobacteriales archaeon QS_5_70_15]